MNVLVELNNLHQIWLDRAAARTYRLNGEAADDAIAACARDLLRVIAAIQAEAQPVEHMTSPAGAAITSMEDLTMMVTRVQRGLDRLAYRDPFASVGLAQLADHVARSLDAAEALRVERWHHTADAALTGLITRDADDVAGVAEVYADERHGPLAPVAEAKR